jgi:hypothetical protein
MNMKLPAGLVALVLAASCTSNVGVRRVKPNDYSTPGYRYYLSQPMLLVRSPIELARTEDLYTLNRGSNALSPVRTDSINAGIPRQGTVDVVNPEPPAPAGNKPLRRAKTPPAKSDEPKGAAAAKPENETGKNVGENTAKEAAALRPAVRADPTAIADTIALVWVPDHCEQYAISQTNRLSSQTTKFSFAEGWRLDGQEVTSDTTVLAAKLVDLASSITGTLVGAKKEVDIARINATATGDQDEEAQAGTRHTLWRRTTVTYLKPGLYSLFTRETCDGAPSLQLPALAIMTATYFDTIDPLDADIRITQ